MKVSIIVCISFVAAFGQTFDRHPNHNYDVELDEHDEHDEHDDHEAQASDGVPSTILAPHHYPQSHQYPQLHHHPQLQHLHPEHHHHPQPQHHLQSHRDPHPIHKLSNPYKEPEERQQLEALQQQIHPQQLPHNPPPTPYTEALKSYHSGRKRYHPPPKQRYQAPYRSKGHHKYPRRPQGHYQNIFSGRPRPKYPPRPSGGFSPRPVEHFGPRPQGHRPPSFAAKPNLHTPDGLGFSHGDFGGQTDLGSKPFSFGGASSNPLGFGGGHQPPGFGSSGSRPPSFGNIGVSDEGHLGGGALGHPFEHKPSPGLDVSDQGGFDPGHLGAGNDLSEEGGSVGSESHYVGTYEGGGGGNKWKGGGEVAGRVKIKVFRGPTQSDGHKHFAPWGYFVSQPNEEALTKAHSPHGHY